MDIEAIRERHERFGNVFCGGESIGDFDPLEIAMDRRDLLEYISELENRLRWRDVVIEQPPIDILLQLRDGDDYSLGYYLMDHDKTFYWSTPIGRIGLKGYPQWRLID